MKPISFPLNGPINVATAPAEDVLQELIVSARCLTAVESDGVGEFYRARIVAASAELLTRLQQAGKAAGR